MTPAQLAGQRVVWSFPGTTAPVWVVDGIRRGEIGAILLFSENGRRAADVRVLVDRLQAVPRPTGLNAPLLVMIDQEGGPVRRLDGPPIFGAADLADLPPGTSLSAGRSAGRLLCRAGVNVDIAPVVDLARPGSVIAAQGRALGANPVAVSRRGVAFAQGLAEMGIAAVPKHFPGLGAAQETTDVAPVRITLPLAEIRRNDERPYRDLIARGVPMVMIASAVYTAFGPRPGVMNSRVVRRELRGRLGFRGVTVADALDTPALAPFGTHGQVAVASARAGVDLLPFIAPQAARRAATGLRDAIRAGRVPRGQAEASLARVMTLRWSVALGVPLVPFTSPGDGPLPAPDPRAC